MREWATRGQPGRQKRSLKARSPKDCEPCWVAHVLGEAYPRSGPLPWQALKSGRGRPKQYDSHGFACMNGACPYYGITDAQVHALRRMVSAMPVSKRRSGSVAAA